MSRRFRRAAVLAALAVAWLPHAIGAQATGAPAAGTPAAAPVTAVAPANQRQVRSDETQVWTPPLQGHAGPEVYTIGMLEDPAVAAYVASLQAGNLGWLKAALDRAELYRSHVLGLIEKYGLPLELQYLPLIESEYRPWVISRSGAAGMWQFMANSIAGYGIRIDDMVDERRDFWKSTDAALRKLKTNYDRLGDWLLALAAYNCGLGCIDRLVQSTGLDDFWALRDGGHLPGETARFVPKFLGTSRVASYRGRFGIEPDWDSAVVWDRIPLERSVNIELLSAVTGAPLALLERGNAELHYPVTPDAGSGYALKVPRDQRAKIETALADPAIALMKYHVHTIRTGDTLFGLGQAFGVTVELIQRHNVGIDARRLQIGAKVFIPLLGDPKPEELLAAEASPPPPKLTASYTVQAGDTLWAVSRRFGLAVEDLASGNGIGLRAVLRPGDVLKVPDLGIMGGQ